MRRRAVASLPQLAVSEAVPTGEELRAFLKRKGLRRKDVAALLYVSKDVVDRWCLPATSSGYYPIPSAMWQLLQLKVLMAGPNLEALRAKAQA